MLNRLLIPTQGTAALKRWLAYVAPHASIALENARLAQEIVASERLSAVGRKLEIAYVPDRHDQLGGEKHLLRPRLRQVEGKGEENE